MATLYCVALPFPGYSEFFIEEDQLVPLQSLNIDSKTSETVTKEDFLSLYGDKYRLVTDQQLDDIYQDYYLTKVTEPKLISSDEFDNMFDILPPCRWATFGGIEFFHISERLCGNIVSWYVKTTDKSYNFFDDAGLSTKQLMNKINSVTI